MELNILLDYLIISIVASMTINSIFRNYAKKYTFLIDIPDRSRRFHKRPTPLTGGIGIFIALLVSGKLYIDLNNLNGYVPDFTYQLILASIPLVCLFLVDDIKGLRPYQRLIVQATLSLYIIFTTGVYLENLGNLFGYGVLSLGVFSIPFTVLCVVGVMNAFNMIDGINGLCSGCAMLSLLLIGFYSGFMYDSMLILIIGSMIGFLLFNLEVFGKRRSVFLGDHGSNLIGFWVAWSAIYSSQNSLYEAEPITMVWIIAIPLLDCVGLIFSRISKGISWSKAGRDHIHHKLMINYTSEKSLLIILIVSLVSGLFGIYLENYEVWVSTLMFLIYSCLYYIFAYYANIKQLTIGNK